MHGIVLMELKKYVEEQYGAATWPALLLAAELPGRMYGAMGDYPDAEVLAIVQAVAKASGRSTDDVLEAFGRFMVPGLLRTYGFLVQREWDAFDLIAHADEGIATVVRSHGGTATPDVEVTRRSPDRLTVRYASSRHFCAMARGLMKGVGDHYGTPIDVSESSCMNHGGTQCMIEVTRVSVAPPVPRTAPEESKAEARRW